MSPAGAPVDEAPVDVRVSTCELELGAARLEAVPERTLHADYLTVYYDIETLSLDPEADRVIQVSLVAARGAATVDNTWWPSAAWRPSRRDAPPVRDRGRVLRKTRELLVRLDPDFVVAYNGVNFDNHYLATRASPRRAQLEGVEELFYLSRFALHRCRVVETSMTKAGRDYEFRYFAMPGRANLDWWVKFVSDDTTEPSQALRHYAVKFCQDDKEDLPYKEIPVLQAGSDADRARLASYCAHDSYLLHRLNVKRNIITEILGYAQVFGVNPEWVYFRGQQVRFFSQLLRRVRTLEAAPLLLQWPAEGLCGEGEATYEGATVNEPLAGYYCDLPVLCDDWKSLYPSTMMAHNLCYSTYVRDPARFGDEGVVAHEVRALGLAWVLHRDALPGLRRARRRAAGAGGAARAQGPRRRQRGARRRRRRACASPTTSGPGRSVQRRRGGAPRGRAHGRVLWLLPDAPPRRCTYDSTRRAAAPHRDPAAERRAPEEARSRARGGGGGGGRARRRHGGRGPRAAGRRAPARAQGELQLHLRRHGRQQGGQVLLHGRQRGHDLPGPHGHGAPQGDAAAPLPGAADHLRRQRGGAHAAPRPPARH